jgi:hypothetical protein
MVERIEIERALVSAGAGPILAIAENLALVVEIGVARPHCRHRRYQPLVRRPRQFRPVVPITQIELPAAAPAEDKLLIKSLKRPAIQAVRLDGGCDSEFSER